MTKTNSTIAITQKTHHIMIRAIRKSSEKFKDEAAGTPIVEFVGLRSKMCSYIKTDEKGGKTAKGTKKNVIKNDLRHEDYKNMLLNKN